MVTPLFSTYRQGENRITATLLAVLQRLSLPNIDQILGPSDDETIKLEKPIVNDKKDKNGKPTPFTFGQPRYVTLKSLEEASRTSELELC